MICRTADPLISLYDIARNTGISRNTVSSYLDEMRKNGNISGPKISLNAHPGYKECVYLLNYKDPYQVFSGMHTFPCVIHHGMTFGDWNTTILTERPLDFSQLLGYEGEVYSGVKWSSCTPRVTSTTWKEGTLTTSVSERGEHSRPPSRKNIPLDWEEDQWRLYHAFRHDLRVPVTPLLKKIGVRYEVYSAWMETLTDHVSIHTGFYPEGGEKYLNHCFLFKTEKKNAVSSLFSLFPATSFIMEIGDRLFISASIPPEATRDLYCLIYSLEKELIQEYGHAIGLFSRQH